MMCSACLEALQSSLRQVHDVPVISAFSKKSAYIANVRPSLCSAIKRHCSTFGSEKMIGNGAAPQLTEEELERVVGGYIGETEKNRN
jgi:hypothetical protein